MEREKEGERDGEREGERERDGERDGERWREMEIEGTREKYCIVDVQFIPLKEIMSGTVSVLL